MGSQVLFPALFLHFLCYPIFLAILGEKGQKKKKDRERKEGKKWKEKKNCGIGIVL